MTIKKIIFNYKLIIDILEWGSKITNQCVKSYWTTVNINSLNADMNLKMKPKRMTDYKETTTIVSKWSSSKFMKSLKPVEREKIRYIYIYFTKTKIFNYQ